MHFLHFHAILKSTVCDDLDTIRHFYKCVSSKIFYKRISFYLKILIYASRFHYTF